MPFLLRALARVEICGLHTCPTQSNGPSFSKLLKKDLGLTTCSAEPYPPVSRKGRHPALPLSSKQARPLAEKRNLPTSALRPLELCLPQLFSTSYRAAPDRGIRSNAILVRRVRQDTAKLAAATKVGCGFRPHQTIWWLVLQKIRDIPISWLHEAAVPPCARTRGHYTFAAGIRQGIDSHA